MKVHISDGILMQKKGFKTILGIYFVKVFLLCFQLTGPARKQR